MLAIAILQELIDYKPETGQFFWKPRPEKYFKNATDAFVWKADNAGKEIFKKTAGRPYCSQDVMGEKLLAHRVALAMTTGKWPEKIVDHINGVTFDNRLCNLREADHRINSRNAAKPVTNTSGHVGVHQTDSGRYAAVLLNKRIGTFDTFEEACAARQKAQTEAGDFTKRHGTNKIAVIGFSSRHQKRKMMNELRARGMHPAQHRYSEQT